MKKIRSIKRKATSLASLSRAFRATGKSVCSIKTLRKAGKHRVGVYRVKYRMKY